MLTPLSCEIRKENKYIYDNYFVNIYNSVMEVLVSVNTNGDKMLNTGCVTFFFAYEIDSEKHISP